jgi:hypothetical protein
MRSPFFAVSLILSQAALTTAQSIVDSTSHSLISILPGPQKMVFVMNGRTAAILHADSDMNVRSMRSGVRRSPGVIDNLLNAPSPLVVATLGDTAIRFLDPTASYQVARVAIIPTVLRGDYVPLAVLIDGNFIFTKLVSSANADELAETGRPLVRYSVAASRIDTLAILASSNSQVTIRAAGGGRMVQPEPWSFDDLVAVSTDGRWLAVVHRTIIGSKQTTRTAAADVTLYDPMSRTKLAFRYTFPAKRLSRAAIARHVDSLAARVVPALFATRDEARRAIGNALYKPEFLPPVDLVRVASDGQFWLRTDIDSGTQKWQRTSPSGDIIGNVVLPSGLSVVAIGPEDVWLLSDASSFSIRRCGLDTSSMTNLGTGDLAAKHCGSRLEP